MSEITTNVLVAVTFASAGTGLMREQDAIEEGFGPSGEAQSLKLELDADGRTIESNEAHLYPIFG